MKFTEDRLEKAIIELLASEGYPHTVGEALDRNPNDVLIKSDLRQFLATRYQDDLITEYEIESIIHKLEYLPASDLYDTNKAIMKLVADGFTLKREDYTQKDLYIQLIDYEALNNNRFRIVNQMEIQGFELRIPDGILYINGLPLVVFEFKSSIREDATMFDAYTQLTTRYKRDIPELFKYNALCVISDGVNSKMGSFFAPYEFYYSWRKVTGDEKLEKDGIHSLLTMMSGLFDKARLLDVIRNFIYVPDKSSKEEKIVCRYPQYYAATKLYDNIKQHMKLLKATHRFEDNDLKLSQDEVIEDSTMADDSDTNEAFKTPKSLEMAESAKSTESENLEESEESQESTSCYDYQHNLRKQIKKMRYLSEFVAPLYSKKKTKRLLKRLKKAQDALGEAIDNHHSQEYYQQKSNSNANANTNAWFGAGWFAAQLEADTKRCKKRLDNLQDTATFW